MLRAFLALFAGVATMVLLVIVVTVVLTRFAPGWAGEPPKPRAGYIFVNLGYLFLAAAAGGYVSAWAAVANPLVHVLTLSIIVLVLSALSALPAQFAARIAGDGCSPIASGLVAVAIR